MDRAECLVFLKGTERTEEILSLSFDSQARVYDVRFTAKADIVYHYRESDVCIHRPEVLDPRHHRIQYRNNSFDSLTGLYRYKDAKYWYLVKGDRHWLYEDSAVIDSRSALDDSASSDVFAYLKELSSINQLEDDDGNRILARRYGSVSFVPGDSILASYLSGRYPEASAHGSVSDAIIFPFGCNRSQMEAVRNALSSRLSVVQGPPGTGKTQVILTIIANLLLRGETAEIVSNNNSAVDNVREKLGKHGFSFLLASLGSMDNKVQFIASQERSYPDMDGWDIPEGEFTADSEIVGRLGKELEECFSLQERLQDRIQEMSRLDVEMRHFSELLDEQGYPHEKVGTARFGMEPGRLLQLIQRYTGYFSYYERMPLLRRIIEAFFLRNLCWEETGWSGMRLLPYLQWEYYRLRHAALEEEISSLKKRLESLSMQEKQEELAERSLRLLRAAVCRRFRGRTIRPVFSEIDIWMRPGDILDEYPIVTSTAFSSASSLRSVMYDYLIIDESSQCDIAAGALSLLSARNAVIVGDDKQLQNIVTEEDRDTADGIFSRYRLPEAYRYSSNSLLSSVCGLFPDAPSVLLSEHYRCQPRIIGFCNEKFYGGRLVIMTEDRNSEDEIMLFRTVTGHHSRSRSNLRQAEVIAREILPGLDDTGDIGIITPYQDNVKLIRDTIGRDDIQVATIHSFQGREKDTIIFATSDDVVTGFSDSAMLINVAVSRAKRRFILVTSAEKQPEGSNMHDLISYISYNSFQTVTSGICSVFDMLYAESTAARIGFLAKHRKVSEYDSENLMYSMLEDIISEERYREYGFRIVCHYPVRYLFRNTDRLTEEERLYLSRKGTHVDFLLYRAIGKEPVAAIEVDGISFHKQGSRQYDRDRLKDSIFARYSLPLLRFRTDGSGEREAMHSFLDGYIRKV